jgi:hypothetical protein
LVANFAKSIGADFLSPDTGSDDTVVVDDIALIGVDVVDVVGIEADTATVVVVAFGVDATTFGFDNGLLGVAIDVDAVASVVARLSMLNERLTIHDSIWPTLLQKY